MSVSATGGGPDPYSLPVVTNLFAPDAAFTGLTDFHKTASTSGLNAGQTTGALIIAGQSLGESNGTGGTFTPTNPTKIDNLNPFDGAVYQLTDPPLGTGIGNGILYDTAGTNLFTRVADGLVTAGWRQRVIICPVDITATSVAQWATSLSSRIQVAVKRFQALNIPVTALLWEQGTRDNQLATSQSAYQTSLTSLITTIRSGANSSFPWFIALETFTGSSGTSSAVRAAQAAVVNNTDIFQGADMDTIGSSLRQASNFIHLTSSGQGVASPLWVTAIQAASI